MKKLMEYNLNIGRTPTEKHNFYLFMKRSFNVNHTWKKNSQKSQITIRNFSAYLKDVQTVTERILKTSKSYVKSVIDYFYLFGILFDCVCVCVF